MNAFDELRATLAQISATIDASYPPTMDPELVLRRRLGKVGVENGEMLQAVEAWTGENPRKGVCGTHNDVVKELLDCASAALCAVEHMTGNRGVAAGMLLEQVQGNRVRLAAALDLAPVHVVPFDEDGDDYPSDLTAR